jgi:cytochrome P450
MYKPPLRWMRELSRTYGDTFRLRVLGPTPRREGPRRGLTPRTVVVTSSASLLKEVFARSRDELLAGEVQDFIAWHSGEDSILVVDGDRHIEERRTLHTALRHVAVGTLTRAAIRRALAAWPEGLVPLSPMVNRAALDAAIACTFGLLDVPRLEHVRELAEGGAITTSVPPSLLVMASLRADGRRWAPAARINRAVTAFETFVADEVRARLRSGAGGSDGSLLDALLRHHLDTEGSGFDQARLTQRVRTMLGGFHTASVAASWCIYHLLPDRAVFPRAVEASRDASRAGPAYLEAVCKEAIRLNPPFLGGFRLVAIPVTFGGIAFRRGSAILPNIAATHLRPEVFPEPLRFDPTRFLDRTFAPHEYGPFGGGVRRCLGEMIVLEQLRILLGELLTTFEVRPAGAWRGDERRLNLVLVPGDPLRADLRRVRPRDGSARAGES